MKSVKLIQEPINLPASQKRELRTQFGALCYRVQKDKVQVLLVTSRGSKRWISPKGWPIDGATPAETAQREAFEEAGAEGKVAGNCLGIYSYTKLMEDEDDLPCVVALFAIKVKKLHRSYPEKDQRERRWFSLKKAALVVDEPELSQIVKNFNPLHVVR
jgi:8-oxo-dGTP pyrophosphatase MutT (NUDIX family)